MFGQDLWQNPNLQASCFLLSEAVAWLKAADSVLARLAWGQGPGDKSADSPDSLPARRAWLRCVFEVRNRLRRFDEELAHLRRGFYAEEVRAAGLLLRRDKAPAAPPSTATRITRPLSVLVIVEPSDTTVPHPHIEGGRVVEPYWSLTPADRAALETALRLRDQAVATVTIQVAAVGPRAAGAALREALSLGADRARLLLAEVETYSTSSAAAALAATLRSGGPYHLVLSGSGKPDREDGLLGSLTAEALGVAQAGAAAALAIRFTDSESEAVLQAADGRQQLRSLPATVAVEPDVGLRPFATAGYLANLTRAVEIERWPRRLEARAITLAEALPAAANVEELGAALTPDEAAARVVEEIGIRRGAATIAHSAYPGAIEPVTSPKCFDGRAVAVLAADVSGKLDASASLAVRAVQSFAQVERLARAALLLAPPEEAAQREAIGQIHRFFTGDIVLLVTPKADTAAAAMRGRLLRECWPGAGDAPRVVVGEPWAEGAFAGLANLAKTDPSAPAGDVLALRVRRLAQEGDHHVLETVRAQGKLRASERLALDPSETYWITLSADAEVGPLAPEPSDKIRALGNVERWSPRLERFFGQDEIQRLLAEVKAEVGVARLADAEFIIDVGFGVGNRDGYEAVIEPLEKVLRSLGVRGLVIGGSRKVTEELHLLPTDRQIGQSGVSVNPRILLAIGISGAPQHLSYIGPRATVLAFNRDSEAPIMTLNRRQPRPRVFSIVGDLFETVPALIAALKRESVTETPAVPDRTPRETASF
jgi:hypothetical protein